MEREREGRERKVNRKKKNRYRSCVIIIKAIKDKMMVREDIFFDW